MRKLLMSIIFNRFFPKWITFKIIRKWNSGGKSGYVTRRVEVFR